MKLELEGLLHHPEPPKNKYWSVEIPVLEIYTQGKTQSDAYRMAKDAIESLVEEKNFCVEVTPISDQKFKITSDSYELFSRLILSRLRSENKLTLLAMARKLKTPSINTFARYEQGRAVPKVDTLEKLIQAINPNLEITLKVG